MLTINAPIFDIQGHVLIRDPDPDGLANFSRRVSRNPTLDGHASITDFGYSPSDRTLRIDWKPKDQAEADNVARMVQVYGRLIISFRDGCFIGAPSSFDPDQETLSITVLIERQINA